MKAKWPTWKFVLIPILMSTCIWIHEWKLLGFYYAGAIIGHIMESK